MPASVEPPAAARQPSIPAPSSLGDDLIAALKLANSVVVMADLGTTWVQRIEGDIEAIIGYTVEEWMALDHKAILHPDDRADYWIDIDSAVAGTQVDRRARMRHKEGHWVWVREVARIGLDERGRLVLRGFFFDITPQVEHEDELRRQARTDVVTGLPNRLALTERLAEACAAGGQFALCMIDLDRFKEVNDTLGHDAGDDLLRIVSQRLVSVLDIGSALFRLGGDEYAIIVPGVAADAQMTALLGRISASAARPIEAWGIQLAVSMSTGVALAGPACEPATLLRQADMAMYAAKRAGDPFRMFDASLDHSSKQRLSLSAALAAALQGGEIGLHFQPKFDMRTNALVGAEGLTRWEHPEYGLLSPAAFLDVALMSESVGEFTLRMVRQAVAMIRRTAELGRALPISVNVPMRALADPSFPGEVFMALAEADVPASLLTVEITESDVIDPSAHLLAGLGYLSDRGVAISVDDFGTGHSSLERLRSFRIDELKIDRVFVTHIDRDARDRQLVRTIIDLATGLGHRIVAEGVETDEQMRTLIELGCTVGQGWLFSKAVPPDEFLAMVAAG